MTQNTRELDALLRPKSIAVVGASKNPDSPGHDYVQCLLDFGFKGEVYPVHRREAEILSRGSGYAAAGRRASRTEYGAARARRQRRQRPTRQLG